MDEKELERQEEEAKKAKYSSILESLLKETMEPHATLDNTKALLVMNPDHYHAWNKRKNALLAIDPSLGNVIVEELELSVGTLRLNPKSYPSWYHRRWLLGSVQAGIAKAIASNELRLCSKLLQLDSRNFHCWNYRAFLCDHLLQQSAHEELAFTKQLILQCFSNYSAWHRRAVVLQRMNAEGKRQL